MTDTSLSDFIFALEKKTSDAATAGDLELARLWKMTVESVKISIYHTSTLGQLNDVRELPLPVQPMVFANATQQSAKYTLQALEAFRNQNVILATELTQKAASMKAASACYHYWTTRVHQETLARYFIEESVTHQKIIQYRMRAAQASKSLQKEAAQQWAEAACLAQETTHRLQKAAATSGHIGNEVYGNRWIIAAYWSAKTSLFRATIAEALEQKNLAAVKAWEAIATLAEEASTYRAKSARMTLQHMPLADSWTTMAMWAGNAANYKRKALEVTEADHQMPAQAWNDVATMAQRLVAIHRKISNSLISWSCFGLRARYLHKAAHKAEEKVMSKLHDIEVNREIRKTTPKKQSQMGLGFRAF